MKQKIKEEQKALAQKIRDNKPDNQLFSWKFRHRHIAYCQFFNNTPYNSIEKPREGNEPDTEIIEKYKNEWEALRSNT